MLKGGWFLPEYQAEYHYYVVHDKNSRSLCRKFSIYADAETKVSERDEDANDNCSVCKRIRLQKREGWSQVRSSYHYFQNGRSLCRKHLIGDLERLSATGPCYSDYMCPQCSDGHREEIEEWAVVVAPAMMARLESPHA